MAVSPAMQALQSFVNDVATNETLSTLTSTPPSVASSDAAVAVDGMSIFGSSIEVITVLILLCAVFLIVRRRLRATVLKGRR